MTIPPQHTTSRFARHRSLLLAGVTAWILTTIITALIFGLGRLDATYVPLSDIILLVIGYAVAGALSIVCIRRAMADVWTDRLGYVLLAAAAVMCVGISINIAGYLPPDGDWNHPVLPDYTDISREYIMADEYYNHRPLPAGSNIGYTLIIGSLMRLFGTGLSAPLILNMMFMLIAIACSGRLAAILIEGADRKKTAFWGSLCCAAIGNILWYGTILMKEAGVVAGMALFGITLASLAKEKWNAASVICGGFGGLLLLLLKSPMGWFCLAGTLIVCARFNYKNPSKYLTLYRRGLFPLLIAGAVIAGGARLRSVPDTAFVTPNKEDTSMLGYDTVERYSQLIPGYFGSSVWHRASLLPLSAAAQYFPPFPWNFTRDSHLGHFVWCAHLSAVWYVVGGLILAYLLLCFGLKRRSGGISRWALWWLVCWLGVAFASGGSVARYCLPFIPIGIPLALQCVVSAKSGLLPIRLLRNWGIIYIVLLFIGLTSAYLYLK